MGRIRPFLPTIVSKYRGCTIPLCVTLNAAVLYQYLKHQRLVWAMDADPAWKFVVAGRSAKIFRTDVHIHRIARGKVVMFWSQPLLQQQSACGTAVENAMLSKVLPVYGAVIAKYEMIMELDRQTCNWYIADKIHFTPVTTLAEHDTLHYAA